MWIFLKPWYAGILHLILLCESHRLDPRSKISIVKSQEVQEYMAGDMGGAL